MDRLTLNVLLSFAQFEREVTGERIHDKVAASKKKGMWMGGGVPFGYDVVDRQLVVNQSEAETVRQMFERYTEVKSVPQLVEELAAKDVRTRKRVWKTGKVVGGVISNHFARLAFRHAADPPELSMAASNPGHASGASVSAIEINRYMTPVSLPPSGLW